MLPPRPRNRRVTMNPVRRVPTVEYVDLTIRPDTPDPRPPKRICPSVCAPWPDPALIAAPPSSPTGPFWRRDKAGVLHPTGNYCIWKACMNETPHRKTAARRLLNDIEKAATALADRFDSVM